MPAPTARIDLPAISESASAPILIEEDDEGQHLELVSANPMLEDAGSSSPAAENDFDEVTMADATSKDDIEGRPSFPAVADTTAIATRREKRKVAIPPHRMAPLKREWPQIYPPLTEHLKLQVRMNPARKVVEMRTSKSTPPGINALQKGEDFVKAFAMGFEVADAIALIRLDDLYTQTFEIKDVKTLQGDHLSRAIGRIAGKDGKTKIAIENATRTRIVLADSKIHILGAFQNIHMAQESIVDLIRGKQPGKVYGNLQKISRRMKERF